MAGLVKICGVTTARDAIAAAKAGADLVGFHFIPKNPRTLAPDVAEEIVTEVKRASDEGGFAVPKFVGVFIDAGEKLFAETAPFLAYFQFHGHENPERVSEIGSEFGVSMIKAMAARGAADLPLADEFADAADLLLLDARPLKAGAPSQTSISGAEWSFLKRYRAAAPFLIAGELAPETVVGAIEAARDGANFAGVDASSGVEVRPGEKDPAKIAAFIKKARGAL